MKDPQKNTHSYDDDDDDDGESNGDNWLPFSHQIMKSN